MNGPPNPRVREFTNPSPTMRDVLNYGRRVTVKGTDQNEWGARIQLPEWSHVYTLDVEVESFSNLDTGLIPVRPWVTIEWSNAGGAFKRSFEAGFHASIPLAADAIKINCYLGDIDGKHVTGADANLEAEATFLVSLAEGTLGLPQRSTRFVNVADGGAENTLWIGPGAVTSIRGYNQTATAGLYLMGFDNDGTTPPPNGSVPLFSIPAPPTVGGNATEFLETWLNGRYFLNGLTLVVSNTPGTLTRQPNPHFRIEAEFFNL